MTSEITRRRFLGTTATLGAAAAVAPASASPKVHPPGWRGTERVDKIPTTCEMCFWRCGVVASVAGGKVVRVAGHPEHPQNQGRLCARGNAGTGLLYDPDRLKTPLLRIGERGEGRFKRVSWDEALEFLAGKLLKLRQEHGPESVALFPHGNGPRFFATLMQAYGTPNSAEPSFAQCRGPREVGYSLTFGRGLGSPEPVDLEEARLIVLIGSHLGENVFTSQITAFATGLAARREADSGGPALFHRRCQGGLVVADPPWDRHCAPAGLDERADRRTALRSGIHRDLRQGV